MNRSIAALLVLGTLGLASPAVAADGGEAVTFHEDVLAIFQENCQTCHRPGGDNVAGMVAPMSLMTYEEVRPWARSIARLVQSREMPPWDASDHTAGVFLNERTLSQPEIDTVVAWVKGGAPKGDPAGGPAPREWEDTGGFLIGKPDLIVYMEEPYHVGDDVEDEQPNFYITLTEEMLPEPRWLQAIEYQPDAEFVHHITGRALTPNEDGEVDVLSENTFSLGSIAAGEDPTIYPPGFGNLLQAGMVVRLNVHYHKEPGPGSGGYDRSAVAFRFHPVGAEVRHKVTWNTIGAGAFEIPPGHGHWRVGSSRVFEKDTVLLSLHPHMHFRGQSMKYTAYYPGGGTEVLLDVPEYDYSWQTNYIYREPKVLPAGTRVEIEAVYDNSETKLAEYPFLDIGRAVDWGAQSTDEMMAPFLAWTYVEPEDAAAIRAAGVAGSTGGGE
jgi:mono/diheme cytochrome c family protein